MKRVYIMIVAGIMLLTAQIGLAQPPVVDPTQLDVRTIPRNVRQADLPQPRISQRQAIELARERFAGTVLRISLVGQGNTRRYQIRMENEGKVFTVFVNANTGAVSGG